MKARRKLTIRSSSLDAGSLIDEIRVFCSTSKAFSFLEDESNKYSDSVEAPCCMLTSARSSGGDALIALSEEKSGVLYLANIVPDEMGDIGLAEANEITRHFANALTQFVKNKKLKVRVVCAPEDIGVEDILRDKRTRRLFDRFMAVNPKSSHPSDIRRLDLFICGLSRYHRGTFYPERLRSLLMEDFGWSYDEASRCSERVEIGLDVLDANRKF
jgi:hypothetical protein